MAKKTALATTSKVTVIAAPFTVNAKGITLTDDFKRLAISVADEVGGFVLSAAAKLEAAINITAAFQAYKEKTENGLPMFVHELFDSTCPQSYGKPDSEQRRLINSHKRFNGFRYLIERIGVPALNKQAERKALIDAGINPDNANEIKEHNKDARDDKFAKLSKAFNKCMVDFHRIGVTETTISNMLICMGKADKKQELTANGKKFRDAATRAVLAVAVADSKTATAAAATMAGEATDGNIKPKNKK